MTEITTEKIIESSSAEADENKTTLDEGGFESILDALIEKIDKPSIRNSLKDSIIINRITSDSIHFITINKVTQLIFSNKEHMRYIEDKLSEVMGKTMAINLTFENKESYFTRNLE